MTMRTFGLVLAFSLTGPGLALADQTSKPTPGAQASAPSNSDAEFVQKAAMDGLVQSKMAELAIDRAQAPEVKQFARRMLADHAKTDIELRRLAAKKHLQVPTQLDAANEKIFEQLASLSGVEFDKQYMSIMFDDQKADVADYKMQAKQGSDPELKSFAVRTLPTLERHFDMAKADKNVANKEKPEKQRM
jgi:putative membrane protein